MFRPEDPALSPDVDFVALEHRVLDLWERERTFAALVEASRGKPVRWSFLDGPITANNPMGVHHAWGRTYKDLFLRFHAMRGEELRWQNGFDCQGLWVEVEVEKELGFKSKREIERYGIDRFVEKCKERVLRFAAVQTDQSKRLGYWMDWDHSYFTMSEENNYCVWLFLKRCHEQGWIYKGTDAMPWCPRCGTGISEMEIASEGYRELTHTSLYVHFPFAGDPSDGLLVWTTTPWTLAANVAAAVHPEKEYARLDLGDGRTGWAMAALAAKMAPGAAVIGTARGLDLVGRRYTTAMDSLPAQHGVEHRVIPWTDVTETEGTGIVHIAPGAGADDFRLGREHGLPVLVPIDDAGDYVAGYGPLSGRAAGSVTEDVAEMFRKVGALYRKAGYTHRYPVCWRCQSELLFRVVDEWFIRMDEVRPRIMEVTNRIRWSPEYGREHELDWLRNMHDWMISKKRYWGLALPIFECDACGWFDVIGSEDELRERAVSGYEAFAGHTPHRPWIDAVHIRCAKCGGSAERIKDVGNPWLDAGIVPFSTLGYRHDRAYWAKWFPADFITESLPGQFRNWFYALLCMSTVLEGREPFRSVLGHALVRDERGEEMHKSKGNSIPFDQAAEEFGVDAMRLLYAGQNPRQNLNFGPTSVKEARRRLLTYWNVVSFLHTYARLDAFDPAASRPAHAERSTLDRWLLSRLNGFVRTGNERLLDADPAGFVRGAESFLEELSNWYLRRSRRRFWKGEADADKRAAYATLYEAVETFTRAMAPVLPFLTEEVWQRLVRGHLPGAPASVHLAPYPVADEAAIDPALETQMAAVLEVIEHGRAIREERKLKVRQPLARITVHAADPEALRGLERFEEHVREELNVKEVVRSAARLGSLVQVQVKPDFRKLGARLGPKTKAVAEAVRGLAGADVKRALDAGAPLQVVTSEGETVEVLPDEVTLLTKVEEGVAARETEALQVVLDVQVTPALRREGLARDLVRSVQDLRKEAKLDVADRIRLSLDAPGEVAQVIAEWGDYVQRETLAVELTTPARPDAAHAATASLGGAEVRVAIDRAAPQ